MTSPTLAAPAFRAPAPVPVALPGPALPGAAAGGEAAEARTARLRQAAQELEASFLAEMLKAAGFGKAREGFGGGAGEDAFASLLVREQAGMLAARGGVGLAEHIYHALVARGGGGDV
ncbi:flagellar biosynthesis protein FlgJ (plasmid) [Paroceanicella profunda]|uniref:Flagellar biosynthesis protein FlgJ n=1 Tax=Paroceanicella profunda TaxID=2579971 RepID=A0A5B8G5M2_9RHOB|nr:rod-binding protein [Paroceanicella profunda]QDL94769.1 flagellar biosynthesis protein FlgJ [Paroceanicella profunda]